MAPELLIDDMPVVGLTTWSSDAIVTYGDEVEALTPNTFIIDHKYDTSFPLMVSLTGVPAGIYQLSGTITGADSESFEIEFLKLGRFEALGLEAPMPPPNILSARFANDASYVVLEFDTDTDYAGLPRNFFCSELLTFSDSNVMTCSWSSTSRLYILMMGDSSLNVDSEILVNGNMVRSKCENKDECATWSAMHATSVFIQPPLKPLIPVVSISAPSSVGPCDVLILDTSGTVGSGGRVWDSVHIDVQKVSSAQANAQIEVPFEKLDGVTGGEVEGLITDGSNGGVSGDANGGSMVPSNVPVMFEDTSSSDSALHRLQDFVMSTNYTISPPMPIPSELLIPGESYAFTVTMCNFLKYCQHTTHRVVIFETVVPSASIPGQSLRRYISRPSLLVMEANNVIITRCEEDEESASLITDISYVWKVFRTTDGKWAGEEVHNAVSIAKKASKFILPSYTLATNELYEIRLVVMMTATMKAATTSILVFVAPSPLVAIIDGGPERGVPVGGTLLLDGSKSHDPDQRFITGVDANLVYDWSCQQVSPTIMDECTLGFEIIQNMYFRMKTNNLAAGTKSVVTLFVKHSLGIRSAQTSVVVSVLNITAPVITLTSEYEAKKFSAKNKLQLDGTINMFGAGNVTWTVDDASIDLEQAALTPVSFEIEKTSQVFLVLSPFSLPVGATLTFVLTCTQMSGIESTVSLVITTNSPPSPGVFAVYPDAGTAYATSFSFVAAAWSDDDLPITYQFGFISDTTNSLVALISRSEKSYSHSQLPEGFVDEDYRMNCVASIFDNLNANSTSIVNVRVENVDFKVSVDAAIERLELMHEESSNDEIKQATMLAVSLVNTVNCTAAPNCTELNRFKCATFDNTCGSCLSSEMLGEWGDSNEPCFFWDESMVFADDFFFISDDDFIPLDTPHSDEGFPGEGPVEGRISDGSDMIDESNSPSTNGRRLARSVSSAALIFCSVQSDCPAWYQCDSGSCVRPKKACW